MHNMKSIVRFMTFFLILTFVTTKTYGVLALKNTEGINGLYRSAPDSIDVLFLGSSHSYCTVNTAILWKEYGMAADDIAEGQQVFDVSYYYLKEALKTQHPKVVFVELLGIDIKLYSTHKYNNTINMKWSDNYVHNLNAVMNNLREDEANADNNDDIKKDILLKFPIIHSRYKGITNQDFCQDDSKLRHHSNWTKKELEIPDVINEKETADFSDEVINTLDNFLSLSKEYGFQLVLWVAPYRINSRERMKQYNAVKRYAFDHNIDFYNLLEVLDDIGFDFSTDMRDEKKTLGSHMNSYGSEKVTRYIGKILNDKYDLPDRRNDPRYARYDEMAREWDVTQATHNLDTVKNLQDYAAALDHTLFDTTVIDYGRHIDDSVLNDEKEIEAEEENDAINLINNAEDFDGWFAAKQDYITYPDRGTVKFSASGLTDLSYTRVEGPLSIETADIMNDEYVLSFEVMSPDWSAVSEPTTEHTGMEAVAFTFVTADESPVGKQLAYRFIRLGKTKSSLWREVPTAVDGEWLKYVSVPLKFTSAKETWSAFDKGIGKYIRVGPSLRANGTVSFRNIKLEKCNKTNDWASTIKYIINTINDKQTDVTGLYTNAIHNSINGAWELSEQVKLAVNEDDIHQTKLYNNSTEEQIKECDVCVVVVDKENGNFIKKDEFTLKGDLLAKN